jgi:exosortase/archaeosortase family protein
MAQAKKTWQKIKTSRDVQQSSHFLLAFIAIMSVLYITSFFLTYPFELFFAFITQAFYQALGVQGEIVFQEPVLLLLPNLSIQISFLCTGLVELMVLVAAILASFGIDFEKKWKGIIGAIATVLVFNALRIIVTSLLIQNTTRELADLAHDLLFRISLFVVIVGFYGLWFYWATGKLKTKSIKGKS